MLIVQSSAALLCHLAIGGDLQPSGMMTSIRFLLASDEESARFSFETSTSLQPMFSIEVIVSAHIHIVDPYDVG